MQDAPSISFVDIELTRRFGNSVLAGALEPERTNNKPPNRNTIPNKLTYVTHYALDMAYVNPPGNTETHRKFKRRLYKGLLTLAKAERGDQELRVTQKHPIIPWTRVWTTLHTAWLPERLKSLWYKVIHDIVPTKERLAAIHLSDTELCNQCGKTDTLQHRITDCGERAIIWNWTRTRIAALLCIDLRYITDD